MARKTTYTPELAKEICEAISISERGLHKLCADNKGFPTKSTIMEWLNKHPDFADQYARARDAQADYMADKILDIADDGSNDLMTIEKGDVSYEVENKEVVNRSKLRVEARKWLLSKLAPKKYGDKIDVTSGGEKVQSNVHVFLPDHKRED